MGHSCTEIKEKGQGTGPPLLEMAEMLREHGARTPNSVCTATKKWVRRTIARLDCAQTADEQGTTPFEQLVETYYQVLVVEVKNLRVKVTGELDNISAV